MPRGSVILYCPALSVVVCVTWWKLDCHESSRQSTTWTPDGGGLLVRPPEITTFRPAVDGSGEDAIVNAPEVHGVVQQAVVQHVLPEQHVPPCAQQVPADWQQTVAGAASLGALTGVGQHGMTIPGSRCCGQMTCVLAAAPAGVSIASTHSEAASNRTDDGRMRRRIAENRRRDYPYL
jgi:hypothetical protein